eukprot:1925038-Pleurochrysis_carterae.AAC.1
MPELEVHLELRKELVEHSVSRSADGADIVAALLTETRAQLATESGAGSLPHTAAGEHPRLREAALNLAMRSREFLDLERSLRSMDFTSAQQQIHALDAAFSANAVLVTRFLVAPSADLRGRHFVFNQLQLCMPEMLKYFSQCQSFDTATRAAHPEAGRYMWHAPAL